MHRCRRDPIKDDVSSRIEADRDPTAQCQFLPLPYIGNQAVRGIRINRFGPFAGEAKEYCFAGTMPLPGPGERSEQIDPDAGHVAELSTLPEAIDERCGRLHRADRV